MKGSKKIALKKIIFRHPVLVWVIIPAFLVIFWIVFSLLFNSYSNFTSISYNHSKNSFKKFDTNKLLENQYIDGSFVAKENDLGILLIHFAPFNKVDYEDEDTLLFRIKELHEHKWYYEGEYRSGIIQDNLIFPFGFPKIENSKGKEYVFEIKSLRGNDKNAVSLSADAPYVISRYNFSTTEIRKNLLSFLITKFISSFTNMDFLLASTTYLLPLFFYISFLIIIRYVPLNKYMLLYIVVVLVLLDTFTLPFWINSISIGVIGLWGIILLYYPFESNFSYCVSSLLFILSFIMLILNHKIQMEKATFWTYIFLISGVVQTIIEIKFPERKYLTIAPIKKKIFRKKNK